MCSVCCDWVSTTYVYVSKPSHQSPETLYAWEYLAMVVNFISMIRGQRINSTFVDWSLRAGFWLLERGFYAEYTSC